MVQTLSTGYFTSISWVWWSFFLYCDTSEYSRLVKKIIIYGRDLDMHWLLIVFWDVDFAYDMRFGEVLHMSPKSVWLWHFDLRSKILLKNETCMDELFTIRSININSVNFIKLFSICKRTYLQNKLRDWLSSWLLGKNGCSYACAHRHAIKKHRCRDKKLLKIPLLKILNPK